jgi:ADP-ribosylglycohydrolase
MELAEEDIADTQAICQLGRGWVGEEALAIAVFCALRYQDDLAECLIAAVTHDGDSDSTGAIAGNILGAWLGASAIPAEWLETIEARDIVERMAVRIHEAT